MPETLRHAQYYVNGIVKYWAVEMNEMQSNNVVSLELELFSDHTHLVYAQFYSYLHFAYTLYIFLHTFFASLFCLQTSCLIHVCTYSTLHLKAFHNIFTLFDIRRGEYLGLHIGWSVCMKESGQIVAQSWSLVVQWP